MREGQFLVSDGQRMRRGLKAVGICSWGYTHAADTLVNVRKGEFRRVRYEVAVSSAFTTNCCRYNSNIEIKSKVRPPLNPDHTHFLMVDDGYRERYI